MKALRVVKWALFGLAALLLGRGVLSLAGVGVSVPASIGIIGGADGPTAIYVTGKPAFAWWLVAGLVCVAAALVLHLVCKHKQK